jgi:hypothetical protein
MCLNPVSLHACSLHAHCLLVIRYEVDMRGEAQAHVRTLSCPGSVEDSRKAAQVCVCVRACVCVCVCERERERERLHIEMSRYKNESIGKLTQMTSLTLSNLGVFNV